MQKMSTRKELAFHFKLFYALEKIIRNGIGSSSDIKQFKLSLDFIAEHGEPRDSFGLLVPLMDPSEPMMIRELKNLAKAITILMNKPIVRTQWEKMSKYYCNGSLSLSGIIPQIKENLPAYSVHDILGIASFDFDRFVRQAALEEMEKLRTSNILPYILLRLNDRAQKNKSLAHKILKKILDNKKVTVNQLVWCRPLIEKAPKEIQANFSNYVQNPDFQAEVKLLLDSHIDEKDKNFLASICKVADEK